jgi:serine/threonine-protein kinase
MAEEKKFDRFGRYLILDHLVDGGMAKICRARFLGEQADKVVAIKMVQPQFSKDDSFKTMFMDEIKTTFGLLHPNIVQTYDYGLQNDQLFVAMEYCDGRNLKEYLDQLKKRNFVFPVEISVYITIQSCQGLHYAHTFTDKLTGKPANIVHRDISPHNIMLTFDGSVKVIDFGIAKSETNSEATQAGTIKGKLSYLAPEYLDGHELDPRYDLFAVGITLWEMLCSRKLFKASNDLAVLKKIQECKVPKPSSINPNVPEELDKIVMKALHKDRNKRFQTLEEFGRALNKFLYSTFPDFNASDLSYFAKELFKEEIKKDRERLYQFGQIDIKPYLADMKREQEGGGKSGDKTSTNVSHIGEVTEKRKAAEQELDFGFGSDGGPDLGMTENETGTKSEITIGNKKVDLTKSKTKVRKLDMSDKTKKTKIRRVKKKKKAQKSKGGSAAAIVAGLGVVLSVFAYKYSDKLMTFGDDPQPVAVNKPKDNRKPANTRKKARVSTVKVKVQNFERRRDKFFVDGKEYKVDILNNVEIPVGAGLTVRVERPKKEHFVQRNVSFSKGANNTVEIDETPDARYGYLMTSRACFRGNISFELFGEQRTESVPINKRPGIKFAVNFTDGIAQEKEYEIYIQKGNKGPKKRLSFSVNESRVVDLCKLL